MSDRPWRYTRFPKPIPARPPEGNDLLETAAQVCTPNELKAFTLSQRGLSERTIALALNLSRSAVRSRIENAQRKIAQHTKDPP